MWYLNKQGGTRSPSLCRLARSICLWAIGRGIQILASHLPGILNTRADFLSRLTHAPHEWRLRPSVVKFLFQKWGEPQIDLFASPANSQLPRFCSWGGEGQGLRGRCPPDPLERAVRICIPPSASPPGSVEEAEGQSKVCFDPGGALVAHAGVVFGPVRPVDEPPRASPGQSGSPATPGGSSPQPGLAAPDCLAVGQLRITHPGVSTENLLVLKESRRPATWRQYASKYARFAHWCAGEGVSPEFASVDDVLSFLRDLTGSAVKVSSARTYLAAILSRREDLRACSQLFAKFFRGLLRIHPPHVRPCPAWDLNVVLSALTRKPFEPLASVSLALLAFKVAFLVAVTSARRVSELQALSCKDPYLQFFPGKVELRVPPSFIPKVLTEFHVNQAITLPVFFPAPSSEPERVLHSLDVARALKFYLQRTEGFRKSDHLFVAYAGKTKGCAVSKATIARWLTSCITLAYKERGRPLSSKVKAHSVRSRAASVAFQRHVPLQDICKAATWARPHTFCKHYSLDVASRQDAAFGQEVLRNLFA